MATKNITKTARLLREALRKKGWSQRDLSRKLKCGPTQINRWCQGMHEPGAKSKKLLSGALGVPIAVK